MAILSVVPETEKGLRVLQLYEVDCYKMFICSPQLMRVLLFVEKQVSVLFSASMMMMSIFIVHDYSAIIAVHDYVFLI